MSKAAQNKARPRKIKQGRAKLSKAAQNLALPRQNEQGRAKRSKAAQHYARPRKLSKAAQTLRAKQAKPRKTAREPAPEQRFSPCLKPRTQSGPGGPGAGAGAGPAETLTRSPRRTSLDAGGPPSPATRRPGPGPSRGYRGGSGDCAAGRPAGWPWSMPSSPWAVLGTGPAPAALSLSAAGGSRALASPSPSEPPSGSV